MCNEREKSIEFKEKGKGKKYVFKGINFHCSWQKFFDLLSNEKFRRKINHFIEMFVNMYVNMLFSLPP